MKKNKNEFTEEQIKSMIENGSPLTDDMIEILESNRIREFISKTIPVPIKEQAEKMNVDIEGQFLNLIFCKQDITTIRERLISKVAGIAGNVMANRYFENKGYKVENEVPILNAKDKMTTASDIVLTSQDGEKTYIELKTIKAIISDTKDYPSQPVVDGEAIPREKYIDLKRTELPDIAVETGEKVPEQLRKTREYLDRQGENAKVKLCVFKGTTISPDIREKVEQYDGIIELPIEIDKIFEYCNTLVDAFMYKGRYMLHPPKGEQEKDVSIPDINKYDEEYDEEH